MITKKYFFNFKKKQIISRNNIMSIKTKKKAGINLPILKITEKKQERKEKFDLPTMFKNNKSVESISDEQIKNLINFPEMGKNFTFVKNVRNMEITDYEGISENDYEKISENSIKICKFVQTQIEYKRYSIQGAKNYAFTNGNKNYIQNSISKIEVEKNKSGRDKMYKLKTEDSIIRKYKKKYPKGSQLKAKIVFSRNPGSSYLLPKWEISGRKKDSKGKWVELLGNSEIAIPGLNANLKNLNIIVDKENVNTFSKRIQARDNDSKGNNDSVKKSNIKKPSIKKPSIKKPSIKKSSIKIPSIKKSSIKIPSIKNFRTLSHLGSHKTSSKKKSVDKKNPIKNIQYLKLKLNLEGLSLKKNHKVGMVTFNNGLISSISKADSNNNINLKIKKEMTQDEFNSLKKSNIQINVMNQKYKTFSSKTFILDLSFLEKWIIILDPPSNGPSICPNYGYSKGTDIGVSLTTRCIDAFDSCDVHQQYYRDMDYAYEKHQKDSSAGGKDLYYADNVDYCVILCHGNGTGYYYDVTNTDDDKFSYQDAALGGARGDYDNEWSAFMSCSVLKDTADSKNVFQRWGPMFNRMHVLLGFSTLAYTSAGTLEDWVNYMCNDDLAPWWAWLLAIYDNQPEGTIGCTLAPLIDSTHSKYRSIPSTISGLSRAYWNEGSWGNGSGPGEDITKSDIKGFWRAKLTA